MGKRIGDILLVILMIALTIAVIVVTYNTDEPQKIVSATPVVTETTEVVNTSALEIVIEQSDVELIAKTVYGEARGCSVVEQSAVIWCILNRVDAGYGTIEEVITAKYQFTGYDANHPVKGEFVELATDVLLRWHLEKNGIGEVGRTLPSDYKWFHGDGKHNHFRNKYNGDYVVWDWNCINPYP